MSRCEKCGSKEHSTLGHADAVLLDELEREAVMPRRVPFASTRPRPPVESLLPFRHGGELGGGFISNEWLVAETMKPFQPKGLMIWNAGDLQVSAAYVGTNLELICGFGAVPAAWFATQQSFEAVVAAQKAGEAAAWGHWSTVSPGVLVRLQFSGPSAHVRALMWGLT